MDKTLAESNPERACAEAEQRAGWPGRISFHPSPIGPLMHLSAPDGDAMVALLGAQVTGWHPANGEEVLFWPPLPPTVPPGMELHGGIPLCWPWFGRMGPSGSLPHGIARYRRFELSGTSVASRRTEAVLLLESPAGQEFPHPFRLEVRIALSESLEISMLATNTGTADFAATAGFHPYLRVSDADAASLSGFEGAPYLDWTADADGRDADGCQTGEYRPVPGSRVFASAVSTCRLRDPLMGRTIALEASGHTRWCAWRSPAVPQVPSAGNLGPGDDRLFACVEPVVFPRCDAVHLAPGACFSMRLVLRTEALA